MHRKLAGFGPIALGFVTACGSSGTDGRPQSPLGGSSPTAGATAAIGGKSGGPGGGSSGGMTARGGSGGLGGTTSSGTLPSTGGGVTGGTSSSSGTPNPAGGTLAGGSVATGGAITTGGTRTSVSTATGGRSSTGGSTTQTAGASFAGGATMGGSLTTGGTLNSGGTRPSGGTPGTGGGPLIAGASSIGGSSGNCPSTNANLYVMGADLSHIPQDENGGQTKYIDTDGNQKDIIAIMKNHGFNFVRLRTFVDPTAADGYSAQGYCDLNHTTAMAKRIKQACMGFLLDLHYSDNWADPGKQCIPVAWQGMTLAQMTEQVHAYTFDTVKALVSAGVRPDIVQVGNEITPGMLIHKCDSTGKPVKPDPAVNGSISNWDNLAGFLKAGIKGVHDVDPNIKIMLHIERGGDAAASIDWLNNALSRNVVCDVFGESTYVAYQGQPTVWQSTFNTLMGTAALSGLKFASAEYNNEAVTTPANTTSMRAINDLIFNLAGARGFGTFFWEPTQSGEWGKGLFTWNGTSCTAIASAFAVYDTMRTAYASRL